MSTWLSLAYETHNGARILISSALLDPPKQYAIQKTSYIIVLYKVKNVRPQQMSDAVLALDSSIIFMLQVIYTISLDRTEDQVQK